MPQPELTAKPLPVACFAPPLTDALLARYAALADALPDARGEVRDAMRECLAAAKLWWELPESAGTPDDTKLAIVHRGKPVRVPVVGLTPDLVKALWDAVPWGYELRAMAAVFDAIPPAEKELRDAAFHLLWVATELEKDREPLFQTCLPGA